MYFHLFFIFIYLLSSAFSGKVMCYLLILHCLTIIYKKIVSKERVDPLFLYCISVGAAALANLNMIDSVERGTVSPFYDYIIPEKIESGLLFWTLGNAFLFFGYDFFKKRSLPDISILVTKHENIRSLYIFMLVLSFRYFYIEYIPVGSLGTIFFVFSTVGTLFISRIWGMTNSPVYRQYAITLFIVQTIMAVLYSYLRIEMIIPSICFTVGYGLGRGNMKSILSTKFLPIVGFLLLFNTFFDIFGNNRSTLGVGIARVMGINKINVETQATIYEENAKQNILERSSVLPQITNIVELTETKGFYGGFVLSPLVTALIPRFLWPDKPLISLGSWFANEIGKSYELDGHYTNSINMTIPGHLYLDFGTIGVIIGCFLFGGLLVLFWNSCNFYSSVYNISGVVLGGYLMVISITGMGADLQIAVTFLSYYLILFALKRFV